MEKNWLIRTKSNHILGPVSREKVLELYANGSIKPDDEICTGNGFWFYIREEDMIERYLKGTEVQGFNPISEAKDVLTMSTTSHHHNQSQDEITLIGNVNLSQLKKTTPTQPVKLADLSDAPAVSPGQNSKKKSKLALVDKVPSAPREKKSHKPQNFLQYLVIVGFLVLFCVVYFRKNLIKMMFASTPSISLISEASAQDLPEPKKKSF